MEIEEPYESDEDKKPLKISLLEYVGDPFSTAKSPGDLARISKQLQQQEESKVKSILKKPESVAMPIVQKISPRPLEEFTLKTGIPLAPLSDSPFTM